MVGEQLNAKRTFDFPKKSNFRFLEMIVPPRLVGTSRDAPAVAITDLRGNIEIPIRGHIFNMFLTIFAQGETPI